MNSIVSLTLTDCIFTENTCKNYFIGSFGGELVLNSVDFYENTVSDGAMAYVSNSTFTLIDSCFYENTAGGLAYVDIEEGASLVGASGNYAAKNTLTFKCDGVLLGGSFECSEFNATSCRGTIITPAPIPEFVEPECYTDKDLVGGIYTDLSETSLYTVCAGTVFEDLLVITRSDITIECEESQTCTFKVSFIPSLYVFNDEELGTITSNVTISGMVFTGYTGEDFIVGVIASDVYFRDCVFRVSYNCAYSVIFLYDFSRANQT